LPNSTCDNLPKSVAHQLQNKNAVLVKTTPQVHLSDCMISDQTCSFFGSIFQIILRIFRFSPGLHVPFQLNFVNCGLHFRILPMTSHALSQTPGHTPGVCFTSHGQWSDMFSISQLSQRTAIKWWR